MAMLFKVDAFGTLSEREWAFSAITPFLEAVEPTAREQLEIHHVHGRNALVALMEAGKVSLEDVLDTQKH